MIVDRAGEVNDPVSPSPIVGPLEAPMRANAKEICGALLCCLSSAAFAPPATANAGPGVAERPLAVELNRLEPADNACRGYFVVRNKLPERVAELRLDVFIFDRKGVILRRVGLTFPDLRPNKTKVVLFDLAEAACHDIGKLLVNHVIDCTGSAGGPLNGCADLIATSTRAGTEFEY
jgi:hypothetical protein